MCAARCSCPTWHCLHNTLLLPADAPDAKLSTVLQLQDSMLQQLQEYNELALQLEVHKPQHPYLRRVRKLPPGRDCVSISSRQPRWWWHFVVNTDSMACDGTMLCCHACGSARQVSPLSASSFVLTRAAVRTCAACAARQLHISSIASSRKAASRSTLSSCAAHTSSPRHSSSCQWTALTAAGLPDRTSGGCMPTGKAGR